MKTAGIYIHIPFCATKCNYCDFYSITDSESLIPRFIKAICKEIEQCSTDTSKWKFDTIFIGGGTPSLIKAREIEKILLSTNPKYRYVVAGITDKLLTLIPRKILDYIFKKRLMK